MQARGERPYRILRPVGLLAAVIFAGGAALFFLGHGRWPFGETLYVAVNAVSTVGFRELDGMTDVHYARFVTSAMIVAGLGIVAYFQSSLTTFFVTGALFEQYKRGRMQTRIAKLKDHVIVAGAGATGEHVIEELHASKAAFVVIDRNRENLERLSTELLDGNLLYVVGDATLDATLLQAGVPRASGVVAALTEDRDNLYVTLSARSLNGTARIVSKVIGADAAAKMTRAGADATVSPNMLGGRRLASELVRPAVVEFLDQMLHDRQEALRIEEVTIPEGSSFVGKQLREVQIRSEGRLLVVALRVDRKFIYNPEPTTTMEKDGVLVVLGEHKDVEALRRRVAG